MKQLIRILYCPLLGIASAMSFVIGQDGYLGKSDIPASSTSLLWTALALCFAFIFHYVWQKKAYKLCGLHIVFGLLFGLLNALMNHLFAYDQWDALLSPLPLFILLVRGVLQGLPMICLLSLIDGVLHSPFGNSFQLWKGFYKHSLLYYMLIMIVGWLPYLIVFFPGSLSWDFAEMGAQFFGLRPMNNWHPVFATWLFGSCIWLGRLFSSDTLGVFLFIAMQTLVLAYALASTVQFIQKRSTTFGIITLLFFTLCPLFGGYAQLVCKDTLYSAFILLFTLECTKILLGDYKNIWHSSLRLCVWALMACLLRSNGLYVILPMAILFCLFGVKRTTRIACCTTLTVALSLVFTFNNWLIPSLGIPDATSSGIYSVCFQQTARVLRDHPESISSENYVEIDRVLEANKIGELYEPWISDPVKFTFRYFGKGADIEKEMLANYKETWLDMMGQYPLDYAESFFASNMSYYTFLPKFEGETFHQQAGNRFIFESHTIGEDPLHVHAKQVPQWGKLREYLAMFARGWRHIPILSLFYVCALYVWLLVGVAISILRQKRYQILLLYIPALLSLGVCMLSPVNDCIRYFLPIIFMTPLLYVVGIAPKQGDEHEKTV